MAEPFTIFTSKVVPLPAENVDTDQIVPARYLKVTDKAGLAEALFCDWRYERGRVAQGAADSSSTGPGCRRPEDPARRRQLRLRLVTRARAVGADRVGHPGDPLDLVRRHLPQQQPQERRAADRRRPGDARPPVRAAGARTRTPSSRSTSRSRASSCPTGSTIDFDIDPFAKRMILAGTDELGYLLSKEPELAAWEAAHPPRIDSLAGAR